MKTYLVKAWSFNPEAVDYYTVKAESEEQAIAIGKTRLKEHTRPWPLEVEARVIAQLSPEESAVIKPR